MRRKPIGVSIIEKLRIPLSRVGGILLLILLFFYQSVWDERWPFISAMLFLVGVVLAAIGAMGRLWCSLYISGYKIHKLVSEGPYSISRNPLYFFTLIGVLGVGFTTLTVSIPAVVALGFAVYYPGVMKAEEVKLRRKYGEIYDSYAQTTPNFFPKLSLLHEPQEYLTHPIIFRKHIYSALWFIWVIGLLEIIKAVHRLVIIPYRLPLY